MGKHKRTGRARKNLGRNVGKASGLKSDLVSALDPKHIYREDGTIVASGETIDLRKENKFYTTPKGARPVRITSERPEHIYPAPTEISTMLGETTIPKGAPLDDVFDTINQMAADSYSFDKLRRRNGATDFTQAVGIAGERFAIPPIFLRLDEATPTTTAVDALKLARQHKPLHRHHVVELVKQLTARLRNEFPGDDRLAAMFVTAQYMLTVAEWFSFGVLSNELMVKRAAHSLKLMDSGLIRMPYEFSIFSQTTNFGRNDPMEGHSGYMQAFYFIADNMLRDDAPPAALPPQPTSDRITIMEFRVEIFTDGTVLFLPRLHAQTNYKIIPGENKYSMNVVCNPMRLPEKSLYAEATSVCDPVAIMNVILNTKNLVTERVTIPKKVNEARERQKKPRLMDYTVVRIDQYRAALRETERMETKGTHASPRPHLRRGHIRHYDDHDVWIRDMIVNAHKGGLDREEYRVKVPKR